MPTSGLKDLVRNPLGIVALFISLIYGVASMLLGVTASALLPDERFPLIVFVVLFPLVVLGVFYILVTRHHGKLYAPSDFKTDDSFLRTLSTEEIERRRENEVNETLPETTGDQLPESVTGQSSPPQKAPPDKPEVAAQASAAGPSLPMQLMEETRKVEDGAIARLEKELGQPATRNIEIAKAGVSFDAFLPEGAKPTFAEVKLLTKPLLQLSVIERALYSALLADRALNGHFRLILVVVYAFPPSELPRVERSWRRKVKQCPAEVDLRFIHRGDLDA
ncbi:hypothetical protein DBR12_15315 [Acidovorax sp. HMWF029]|uniref:hypothetical protein n=1 Tax=Acidovorax sp. HMWF029 TaxID=2056863 RepID=UPI000D3BA225|nr:hypothetical protein [Acidovorax sp. HMWF029]PTT18310.1 hypothetical protein DBR12_15315 [Acidovorax sp. HMWF029]